MKTFEVEIWTEDCNEELIYQINEESINDAFKRAIKSIKVLRMNGMKCKLRRIHELKKNKR